MPDIKKAVQSIGALRRILKPYEYLPDAATAIMAMDEAEKLLKNPTDENIKAILVQVREWEKALEPYKEWVPEIVTEILGQTAELRKALTAA